MKNILIVDDKVSIQMTLEAVLDDLGYIITCANDGAEALNRISQAAPDHYHLIISDIIMPNVNGIEFITGIRSVNNQTPVLLISGGGYDMGAEEILTAAQELANSVLKKPFSNEELIAEVEKLTA